MTKKEALSIVFACAPLYKENLVDKSLLFITTEMKMRVLPSLMKKNLSAKMLGDYNMSQPKLYTDKIAGSLSACMGFVRDGGEGRFVPNTVLEGDIRTKVKTADRIIATYRKSRSEEQYSEIVFTAKKVEWEKIVLPEEYRYLALPQSAAAE